MLAILENIYHLIVWPLLRLTYRQDLLQQLINPFRPRIFPWEYLSIGGHLKFKYKSGIDKKILTQKLHFFEIKQKTDGWVNIPLLASRDLLSRTK